MNKWPSFTSDELKVVKSVLGPNEDIMWIAGTMTRDGFYNWLCVRAFLGKKNGVEIEGLRFIVQNAAGRILDHNYDVNLKDVLKGRKTCVN